MNEESFGERRGELDRIYDDTSFFIDAITSEYGFYSAFIKAVEQGKTALSVQRQQIRKSVETVWLDAIEAAMPALDTAIRRPSVGMEEKEDILPIEFSHHITEKSLQHLAQHTDYISHMEGDMVMPSKILNVYYDETAKTYENKFLNTLIDRLMVFVDRRYDVFKEKGLEETNLRMHFQTNFQMSDTKGKIDLSIESEAPSGGEAAGETFQRVKKLRGVLAQYKDSAFVKSMEGAMIQPPVMRTNAIRKNKYLGQCLDLWDFIEAYDKAGFTVETSDQTVQPDDAYIKQLYSVISLQYMFFCYRLNQRFAPDKSMLDERRSGKPLEPAYIREFQELDAANYNVLGTEMRRIVNVFDSGQQRRLTPEETKVRDALVMALREDRLREAERKKALRQAAEEEKARQAAEERRQARILAAKREKARRPGRKK